MNVNLDTALRIFTLGVKFGTLEGRHGFEPDKMEPDDVAWVLKKLLELNLPAIEKEAATLIENDNRRSWYVEQSTGKTCFRFGVIAGFQHYAVAPEHGGEVILTEEAIAKMTQEHFRGAKGYDE